LENPPKDKNASNSAEQTDPGIQQTYDESADKLATRPGSRRQIL